jgi:hypothetical protein
MLQKNQESLEQILVWMKIAGFEKLKKVLEVTLDSPQKKVVYQLSDGRSNKEIVTVSEVSAGAVSGYWKAWKNLGLMKTQKVMGGERSVRLFDLEDLEIEVPKLVAKQESTQPATEQAETPAVLPKMGEGEQ